MTIPSPRRPLEGVKVLDLSRLIAGPFCGQMLGDYGADVVKVEPPDGDRSRQIGGKLFDGFNRSKRSIAIDLASPDGQAVLLQLLEDADVLLNNFKPGTLERWGLGFEQLHPRFPRLIVVSVTGFGATGPLGGMPGTDGAVAAWAGLLSVNGDERTGPMRYGVPMVDLATGLHGMVGVLLALHERHTSGKGQHVDVALFDCALAMTQPQSSNWLEAGVPAKRSGNHNPNAAPFGMFKTGGGIINIGASTNRSFYALCDEVGRPDIAADPRFALEADRVANREALTAELEAAFAQRSNRELAIALVKSDVVAGPVLSLDESLADPHTLHREMVVKLDEYGGTGIPIKLSRTPGAARRKPPAFAEHADEVLQAAGVDGQRAKQLRERGVVPVVAAPSRTATRKRAGVDA